MNSCPGQHRSSFLYVLRPLEIESPFSREATRFAKELQFKLEEPQESHHQNSILLLILSRQPLETGSSWSLMKLLEELQPLTESSSQIRFSRRDDGKAQ